MMTKRGEIREVVEPEGGLFVEVIEGLKGHFPIGLPGMSLLVRRTTRLLFSTVWSQSSLFTYETK